MFRLLFTAWALCVALVAVACSGSAAGPSLDALEDVGDLPDIGFTVPDATPADVPAAEPNPAEVDPVDVPPLDVPEVTPSEPVPETVEAAGESSPPETQEVIEETPDVGQDETLPDLPGPDTPPPDCNPEDSRTVACGLNGNGHATEACVDGTWTAQGGCSDPDVCVNGKTQSMPCDGGVGMSVQECKLGQWVVTSACAKTGQWTCQDSQCVPSYDAAGCGDGFCYLSQGESNLSCPADCDFSGTEGEGQWCDSAIQCAFYAWPAGGVGYWECSGYLWDQQCHAVHDPTFCGTAGQDYCYRDQLYAETPASCPSDCPGPMDCGAAEDCVLHVWPAP
jgi:hypothetical protein